MKIDNRLIDDYLDCTYKAFLRSQGEFGIPHGIEALTNELDDEYRTGAEHAILSNLKIGKPGIARSPIVARLNEGRKIYLRCIVADELYSFEFDAIIRTAGQSRFGPFQYRPVIFNRAGKVIGKQRLRLAIAAYVLDQIQHSRTTVGLIVTGPKFSIRKLRVEQYQERVAAVTCNVTALAIDKNQPALMLNRHCDICEFRLRCREEAVESDNLSLLRGTSTRQIEGYHNRGIFTLHQLSYTFRPRRRSKFDKNQTFVFQPSLRALALRQERTYVVDRPKVPRASLEIYLDMEGDYNGRFIYLIGALVVKENKKTYRCFWADDQSQESGIFLQFHQWLRTQGDFRLFHYGSYESKALNRVELPCGLRRFSRHAATDAVNVLSLVYGRVYFPTYSNGLKEIGGHLGFTWTEKNASGSNALVMRLNWERSHETSLKRRLIRYNEEDCAALHVLTERLRRIARENDALPEFAMHADDLLKTNDLGRWGNRKFAVDEFESVSDCSYFDYQRSKVFCRTNPIVRTAIRNRRRQTSKKLRPNKTVDLRALKCWRCKGTDITRDESRVHSKMQLDLRISTSGIHRKVIRFRTPYHRCNACRTPFLPKSYKNEKRFGHNLMVWTVYQQVVNRFSLGQLHLAAKECFGLRIPIPKIHSLKRLAAKYYRQTYNAILRRLTSGSLIHVDETMARVRDGNGYVWVFASMDSAAYMYRASREGTFLHELLDGFNGVLVSDFYSAYDSMPCRQQKCLVHLMWDMNTDLLRNPFDSELKWIGESFGQILKEIILTTDKYGLKSRFLRRHVKSADRFLNKLEERSFSSKPAQHYQARFKKYRESIFTFLRHDNVPWNNNNAEHAVKPFANYRRMVKRSMTPQGVQDYLVMLSIFQTCEYRGVSFYDFLLSKCRNVDKYCQNLA